KSILGEPLRLLPRLHGLHDRVSFGRRLRQADRSHARADRTPAQALPRRETLSSGYFFHVHAPRSPALAALAASRLPEVRPANPSPRFARIKAFAQEVAGDGSPAASIVRERTHGR